MSFLFVVAESVPESFRVCSSTHLVIPDEQVRKDYSAVDDDVCDDCEYKIANT